MSGTDNYYRVRIGGYRIIYRIEEDKIIAGIGPRGQVYKGA
jgi:mRNA-degrading endonuclease RelE of RelBE toxin-antitoxin system